MQRRVFWQSLLLSSLLIWGCRVGAITDDRGVDIVLSQPAQRVAAISTFGADLLLTLGIMPAAVTSFGPLSRPDFLAADLENVPIIGSRAQINMELLSEVDPDLILAIRRYTEKSADQLARIAPYMALDLVTLEDSYRGVQVAGAALGKSAAALELNSTFTQTLSEFQARAPGDVSAALLVTSTDTPFIYYDHFISAQLLTYLNATNIAGASPNPSQRLPLGYRISLEALLEADPDVIFLFASNKKRAFTLNPIWPYLKAVRNQRVYEVGHHWKEAAGPQARALILREMAHRLYPEVFPLPALPPSVQSRLYH